jgi:hypothetical protein
MLKIYTHPNLPKGRIGQPALATGTKDAIRILYMNPEDFIDLLKYIKEKLCTNKIEKYDKEIEIEELGVRKEPSDT